MKTLREEVEALRDEWREEGEDFEINEEMAAVRLDVILEADLSGPDGPVADSADGYKILQCEHEFEEVAR